MKTLNNYIKEGLINRKIVIKTPIKYAPKTRNQLCKIIVSLLSKGITDLNCIDVSNLQDLSLVFLKVNEKISVKDIDISGWDVSNIKLMFGVFSRCKEFNSDLSNWDVSNVIDMCHMFAGCEQFNSDLSTWDVSNVTNMEYMFLNCKAFNSDLSKWDMSNVTDMSGMFDSCNIPKEYKPTKK